MLFSNVSEIAPSINVATADELQILNRVNAFRQTGFAYAMEHGSRPATIDLVLSLTL
jgi:hypothetical protein